MKIKYIDVHTHNPQEGVLSPTMAGIHPWQADKGYKLPDFAQCDIVGETGLDYVCDVDKECQKRLFIRHLEEATKVNKPQKRALWAFAFIFATFFLSACFADIKLLGQVGVYFIKGLAKGTPLLFAYPIA